MHDHHSASVSFVVDIDSTASALGSGDVPVLGTPKVVALCEAAAVAAVAPTLATGETTVGTEISVRHVAPSPVGATVVATAVLVETRGRRNIFTLEVKQDDEVVATGSHIRAVVDRDRFIESTTKP